MEHGCKYAYNPSQHESCPVVAQVIEQEFPCERCDEDREKTEWIEPIVRRFLNFKDPQDCKLGNALIGELKAKAKEVL
jgi:hypothetical protein